MKYKFGYCIIVLLTIIMLSGCSIPDQELTVGYIFTDNILDTGINQAQNDALNAVVKKMDGRVKTIVKESVNESNIAAVIYDMVNSGAKLIFISDPAYEGQIVQAADVYDSVYFVVYNGNSTLPNLKSYSARLYEADYLAGIIAGKTTQNNQIGYLVPDLSQPYLVQVNSFALGVLKSNPNATVEVDEVGDSPSVTRLNAAVSKLTFNGCDVLGSCLSSNSVLQEAANEGLKVIGNSETGLENVDNSLTAVTLDYEAFYTQQIEDVLHGTFDPTTYVGTFADGFVDLSDFSLKTPLVARDTALDTEEDIRNGNLAVFTGPFSDNVGNIRAEEGVVLSEADLMNMDYLLSNVVVVD